VHDHRTNHHGRSGANAQNLEPAWANPQTAKQGISAGTGNAEQSPEKQQVHRVRHGEPAHRETVVTGQTGDLRIQPGQQHHREPATHTAN
jgi:hypothetical protein